MKVQMAVIKLVLRTNKVLADGSSPIMLRVSFGGMKERSTGYSCSPRYWDKRNECVKKGFPNYVMVNAELKKLKDAAISKRDSFIASGDVYTPAMILEKEEVRSVVTNDFATLIARYIEEKGLKRKTVDKWVTARNHVLRFAGRDILVNEINESFCRRYCSWLEGNGISSGTIKAYMSNVAAILHYALEIGLISKYPLSGWKYYARYKESKKEIYIHARSVDVMIDMFIDELIEKEGSMWHYRDGVVDRLMDIHSSLYGRYLWVISYYLCGLAPIDASMLKKKDIKVIVIKDKNYYAIDGSRMKTGKSFKIRLAENTLMSNVLIRTMLLFNEGEFFLPTLQNYGGRDLKKRVTNIYAYHGEHLKEWFKEVNAELIRRNVEEHEHYELIDLECKYYSARHSYIMKEIQKPNLNLLKLATSTGKSVTTLHEYLTLLNDLDLVED